MNPNQPNNPNKRKHEDEEGKSTHEEGTSLEDFINLIGKHRLPRTALLMLDATQSNNPKERTQIFFKGMAEHARKESQKDLEDKAFIAKCSKKSNLNEDQGDNPSTSTNTNIKNAAFSKDSIGSSDDEQVCDDARLMDTYWWRRHEKRVTKIHPDWSQSEAERIGNVASECKSNITQKDDSVTRKDDKQSNTRTKSMTRKNSNDSSDDEQAYSDGGPAGQGVLYPSHK
jgi:hypothetical protein